jgi:hypothetical protein
MHQIDKAIHASRQVAQTIPDDYPDLATLLNDLRISLGHRYKQTAQMADLEEAIPLFRQALDKPVHHHRCSIRYLKKTYHGFSARPQ